MNQRLQNLIIVGAILLLGFVAFWHMKTALAWGIIPLIIAIPWMLGDSRRLLGGYWLWATVCEYAYQVTRIGTLRYGDEALLGSILVAILFQQALSRKSHPDLRGLMAVFFALVLLLGFSHYINGGSHVNAAITLVQYFRPFVLGFFAYISLKPGDFPGLAKFFLATLLLQLVINLAWYFDINPLPHPGIYVGVDFAVGTMGSSLFVGYTACLGIVLCVAIFLVERSMGYLVVGGFLTLSLALTNTMHAYAFLAFMLIVVAMVYTRGGSRRVAAVFATAVPLLALALLVQTLSPSTLNLDFYLNRASDLMTGRKMAAYKSHLLELPRDSSVPLFVVGTGPGTLGTAMADQRSYLSAKYHGWAFSGAEAEEVQTRSIVAHTRTGFLAIWSDLGPIAFLLYWGSHVYALLRVIRANRRGAYVLPWQRAFAIAFIPTMMLYLMVAFMTDIVHTALWGTVPWVWASTVWTPQPAEDALEVEPSSADETAQELSEGLTATR